MTWTKLDEDFPQHPKIIAAGERPELLHVHALIYCNRFLTDGFIPKAVAPTLTRHAKVDIQRLVELGIWMEVEQGYEIHDFLDYQPSRDKVLAERKQKASAGQAGGLARAKHLLKQAASRSQAEALVKSKPVSVPVSEPLDASSVGSLPDSPALQLAVAMADLLHQPGLSPLDIQVCEKALRQFPNLVPEDFIRRAKDHQDACATKGFPIAQTVRGLWEAWRQEDEYQADHKPAAGRSGTSRGMQQVGAIMRGES